MSRKSFFAGLACGLLAAGAGFYSYHLHQKSPTVGSDPMASFAADSRFASTTSAVAPNVTGPNTSDVVQVHLRAANFPCDQETTQQAIELKRAGWIYVMPQPKDARARWGNSDDRSTWWVGYWTNERDHTTSATQPERGAGGQWVGDGKGIRHWRRGGSPLAPSKIEWLCSSSGGITPQ